MKHYLQYPIIPLYERKTAVTIIHFVYCSLVYMINLSFLPVPVERLFKLDIKLWYEQIVLFLSYWTLKGLGFSSSFASSMRWMVGWLVGIMVLNVFWAYRAYITHVALNAATSEYEQLKIRVIFRHNLNLMFMICRFWIVYIYNGTLRV